MKKHLTALVLLSLTACTRIEPGKVGIVVDQFGGNRGVQQIPVVSGFNFYNPVATDILEYPVFVQTAVWTHATKDSGQPNEEVSFSTKDGMIVNADVSLSYQLVQTKVAEFYVKFRSDNLDTFTHGYLRNVARDAFNEEGVKYSVEEVYGAKKEELLTNVRKRVNDHVGTFGVQIQQFGFVGAVRLPEIVVSAINAKIQATQEAMKIENELRASEAQAKKALVAAEATAKANELINRSVTPTLLQWRAMDLQGAAIQKWDGKMPYMNGGGSVPFIQMPASK